MIAWFVVLTTTKEEEEIPRYLLTDETHMVFSERQWANTDAELDHGQQFSLLFHVFFI